MNTGFHLKLDDESTSPDAAFVNGTIQLGAFSERFEASLSYWTPEQYRSSWRAAASALLEGADKSAFITSMTNPVTANFIFWWTAYRDGEQVHVQQQVLFMEDLNAPFNPSDPYSHIGPRELVDEEGNKISEWTVGVEDIRVFLKREEAMASPALTVTEAANARDYWVSRPYVAPEVRASANEASILILPTEGFRDHEGPLFPVNTEEIFNMLRDRAPDGVHVELCVDDDKYHELALHGFLLVLGTFLVTSVGAPLLVNVLWDAIQKRRKKDKAAEVRVRLLVERTDGAVSSTLQLDYDGPADAFMDVMSDAVSKAVDGQDVPQLLPGDTSDDSSDDHS